MNIKDSIYTEYPNLSMYIERKNSLCRIFWADELSLPPKPDDQKALINMLVSDFSPENITCDGEVRGRRLEEKAIFLYAVKVELEELLDRELKEINY